METIAVYWEPVIKTYGISVRDGLSLWSLTLSAAEAPPAVLGIRAGRNLELVTALPRADGGLRLHLLLNDVMPSSDQVKALLQASPGWHITAPVTMLFCQGPHFGDRYGIAQAALNALQQRAVTLLTAACTGASLHFVVPQEQAVPAHKALCTAFVPPAAPDRPVNP